MAKVALIFVGGDSAVDNLIKKVTGGEFSHVAGLLFDSVYESTGMKESADPYPGVWLHAPDKYDSNPLAVKISVEVPDFEALKVEARRLLGCRYAYWGCIEGGLHELTGINLSVFSDFAVNCSETWTRLLRAGGYDPLPGMPADVVTPADLYNALEAQANGQKLA